MSFMKTLKTEFREFMAVLTSHWTGWMAIASFLIGSCLVVALIIIGSVTDARNQHVPRFEGEVIHQNGDYYAVRIKKVNPRKLLDLQTYIEEGRGECRIQTSVYGALMSDWKVFLYKCEAE